MNIRAEYLVGKQKGNEWAGVYGYRPEDDINRTSTTKAEMFAVVRIETEAESKNLERISKMLLDELQEIYFEDNTSADGIIRIETAFNKMKAKLEVILSREEEILEKGIDIEIGAAFLLEGSLYLGVVGESKVFIFRNNKLVDISSALVDANLSGFIKTGSLKVSETDIFCLATSNAAKNLDELENGVASLSIDQMKSLKEQDGVAVLLFADESLNWSEATNEAADGSNDQDASIIPAPVDASGVAIPVAAGLGTASTVGDLAAAAGAEGVDEVAEFVKNSGFNQAIEGQVGDNQNSVDSDQAIQDSQTQISNDSPFNEEEFSDDENEYDPLESDGAEAQFNTASDLKSRIGGIFSGLKVKAGDIASKRNSNVSTNNFNGDDEVSPTNKVSSILGSVKSKAAGIASNGVGGNSNPSEQKTYIKIINDILSFIKRGVASLLGIFNREILGREVDRSNIAGHQNKIQRNRKILMVVLIIAVVFIYLGIRDSQGKRADAERAEDIKTELTSLQSEFTQLNSQVETTKSQDQGKKDLLATRINEVITKANSAKSAGLYTNDFENLIDQAGLAKDNLLLIKEINSENMQLIADIGKVQSDAQPNDIVFTSGNIFVSDFKRGVVYKILPQINSDPTEFATDLKSPSSLTLNVDGDIVFYDADTSTTIGKISPATGAVTRFPFLGKAVAGTSTKAATYSGNNALYEIHQDHQQIFKRDQQGANYAGGGAIYSSANPPNWKTDPEFAKAIDIAVPYEVYVLIQGGGLRRYLGGGANGITFETFIGLSRNDYDAMNNSTSFGVDGSILAVADPKNQRVLVFEIQDNDQKTLKFVRQFVFRGGDSLKSIKEVAVNSATNSIYILDGTKVIKLAL